MGAKRHHKKKYYSVTDRPIFKILSTALMTLTFAVLYYLLVILLERPGLALTCSVPCMLVLVWVAVKQLLIWWIWLVCAIPCVVLMVLFRQPPLAFILESIYWGMSFVMCQWLILAPSRAKSRANMRKKTHKHHQYSQEPIERPRDELLEKLFGDCE